MVKSGEKLKILIVGLGSIGQRYSNVLQKDKNFSVSAMTTGQGTKKIPLNLKSNFERIYSNFDEINFRNYDFAIVCNPTFKHYESAKVLIKNELNFLLEKPAFSTLNELKDIEKLAKSNNTKFSVGQNMRFHPIIRYLKSNIEHNSKIFQDSITNVEITNLSYLPDWHPWEDYRTSYVANPIGGGVRMTQNHELDYSIYLLGRIEKFSSSTPKNKILDIKTEENATYQIVFKNNIMVNINLSIASKRKDRKITINTDKNILDCNLLTGEIIIKTKNTQNFKNFKISLDNTYKNNVEEFINFLNNKKSKLPTKKEIELVLKYSLQ